VHQASRQLSTSAARLPGALLMGFNGVQMRTTSLETVHFWEFGALGRNDFVVEVSSLVIPDAQRPYLRFCMVASDDLELLSIQVASPSHRSLFSGGFDPDSTFFASWDMNFSSFNAASECSETKWRRANLSLVPFSEWFREAESAVVNETLCAECFNIFDCPECISTTTPISIGITSTCFGSESLIAMDGLEFVGPSLETLRFTPRNH